MAIARHNGALLSIKPRYHRVYVGHTEYFATSFRVRVHPDDLGDETAVVAGNLANAFRQQGEIVEALRHYGMALEFRPEDPAIHYNVAMVLTMIGQTETGVEHFRETVRLFDRDR